MQTEFCVYEVYYKIKGKYFYSRMQGADILSALKLYTESYPDRLIVSIKFLFSYTYGL